MCVCSDSFRWASQCRRAAEAPRACLTVTPRHCCALTQGIRVNCIAPGIVPTKFASYLVESPELAKQQADSTALKRLGRPEDMAAVAAFLASCDADYVTGETLVVAGGMHSRL